MNLSIREMVNGGVVRLRYTFRYSTSRVSHPESVAEHSYYVALYCMFIARWCEESVDSLIRPCRPVDTENLLQRALLHDLEESRSGDFPRPFKHSSNEMKKLLDAAGREAFVQTIEPVTGKMSESGEDQATDDDLDVDVTVEYVNSWMNAKDSTVEGRILEFADFLSTLSFFLEEGAASGNRSIRSHCTGMDKYFDNFLKPEYDFIRPLIDQTSVLMQELFHDRGNQEVLSL